MKKNTIKLTVAALCGAATMTLLVSHTSTHTHGATSLSTMDAPTGDPIPMEESTTTTTMVDDTTATTTAPVVVAPTTSTTAPASTTNTTMVPTTIGTALVEEAPTTTTTMPRATMPTTTTTGKVSMVGTVDVHIDPENPNGVELIRTNTTDTTMPAGYDGVSVVKASDGTAITVRINHPELAPGASYTGTADIFEAVQSVTYVRSSR